MVKKKKVIQAKTRETLEKYAMLKKVIQTIPLFNMIQKDL